MGPKFARLAQPAVLPIGEHWFFYSPQSEIALRRLGPATRMWPVRDLEAALSREPIHSCEDFDRHFEQAFVELLSRTLQQKRRSLGDKESCFRWIFSECDLLPGLVVDLFASTAVCQIQSAPVEHFWKSISLWLQKAWKIASPDDSAQAHHGDLQIVELRNSPSRKHEGLNVVPRDEANPDAASWQKWNGLEWWMNPAGGQKTGAYFDQRDNHRATAQWAQRLELTTAWDVCCFEGGFGLHLAQAGLNVLAVDESQAALSAAAKNAERNGIPPERYKTEKADAFEFMRSRFDARDQVDCLVLDPPGFVKNRAAVDSAMRGFKELNLRGLHCTRPGGLLVTCACSHHVSREAFGHMLFQATHDARRQVKILEIRGPSPDHAPLTSFPESEYLQAWYLEVT